MIAFIRCLTLGLVLLCAVPAQAAAQSGADAAVEQARSQTGGRVLSVRPSPDPNRPGFEVKVLLGDGTVRVLYINPR